jgi:putative endonuclease
MVSKHAPIVEYIGEAPVDERVYPAMPAYDARREHGWEPEAAYPWPSTVAVGARAETVAVELLETNGYHIVERNFRCKLGELDLVARDDGVLCFVEVRSRADGEYGHAAETVTATKRRRVSRAAEVYIAWRQPRFECARFDVVAITGDEVVLIRDAWRLGS